MNTAVEHPPVSLPVRPFARGVETIPPGEPAHIAELLALLRRVQERHDRSSRGTPRTVHAKQHGCVRAELKVESTLAPELRQGLFTEPGRVYPALVRFSNARRRDDRLSDAHGMALKLFEVDGVKLLELQPYAPTHDFVLVDHPVFFARNVADLVPLARDFCRLVTGGLADKARVALKGVLSQDYQYRLLRRMMAKWPDSPLSTRYWSTTPSRFGGGAAKFSLRPEPATAFVLPVKSEDRLRRALSAHLGEREARFDFLVQLQTDPVALPLEDASAEWPEAVSPWRKVATLRIPAQRFETVEQRQFGENLGFTPWHALPAHQPLGGINRARRKIYEAMAARRHELNGVSLREPTLEEVNALWPAGTWL